ncbi:Gfo/Idh/MocA family protein [Jiangella muralis]|uniref:Gfo/Idh/MocA family protein n=1 Tax=Jiangella muralis TaxID=702383 RepID=UPI00069CBF73|nr:Gfo/Idh/MocA family oxidoreductase [Jiangella muralis]
MSKETVVALIGAGGIAEFHLPALLTTGARVVVWSQEGAPELVRRFGGEIAGSFEEALGVADVVDVATPTDTHHALASAALLAGKDVILEKPVARTAEQVSDLRRLSAETGRRVFPGHVVRYFPEYATLHAAVRDKVAGELAVLRFVRSGAFPARSAWFADPARSGGIILDLMIHDIDIARWIAGEVRRVSAVARRIDSEGDVCEAAHVLLEHDSGAITHVAGVWGPPHIDFTTEYSVAGTGGVLSHSSSATKGLVADVRPGGGPPPSVPASASATSPFALEVADFLRAREAGEDARVTFEDGARAAEIALAAIESTTTGQPVLLDAVGAGTRG